MKKLISLVVVVMVSVSATFAQTPIELAKQQAELNAFHMKMLNAKSSKDAKKQAKDLRKEGWMVPAGEKTLERQITESQLYSAEMTTDENGLMVKRYIMQTAVQTAGSYNAGYAAARTSAQVELAAMLKTQIAAAMQQKLDNNQSSMVTSTTVDKFHQRSKAIVDETLTNSIPVLAIYRRLSNNQFEVQVRLAFDKKELVARLKRNMQQELENEGDGLSSVVDDVFNKDL